MAVAVKTTTQTTPHRLFNRLAVESFLGVLYVFVALGVVFYLLPQLWKWALGWDQLELGHGSPVGWALLIVVGLAALGGFIVGGIRLAGPNPVHGLRAGIFLGFIAVVAIALLTCGIGTLIERWLGDRPALGMALTVAVGLALLLGVAILFTRDRFENALIQIEDQGWFSGTSYKRSQGQRVRRGTILGILILAACGIFTLVNHGILDGTTDWLVTIPFSGGWAWPLLLDMRLTVPLLLTVLTFWLAFRIVNFPTFADFLIATEAELNKVSWTTRKRLVQDTVVVLVTVVLLTTFLFVVDQIWAQVLTRVGVLQVQQQQDQTIQKEQPW